MKKVAGFPDYVLWQLPRRLAMALVRGYQLLVSPILPGNCRFYPTCSSYAIDAFRHHGIVKGAWFILRRLARCHPWGGEGFDPVPESSLERHHHKHTNAGHKSCRHAS